MISLDKLNKLASGASMGPWNRTASGHIYAGNDLVAECPPTQGRRGERNAKFIAAADPVAVRNLVKTARLAERFARAKGRHHSQHAMCDLLEHFGLPCVRPGDNPVVAICECGDQFPPDSYGAGFMDANNGVCQNCAASGGGDDQDDAK